MIDGDDPTTGEMTEDNRTGRSRESGDCNPRYGESSTESEARSTAEGAKGEGEESESSSSSSGAQEREFGVSIPLSLIVTLFGLGCACGIDQKSGDIAGVWSLQTIVSAFPILFIVWTTIISIAVSDVERFGGRYCAMLWQVLVLITVLFMVGPAKAVIVGGLYVLQVWTVKNKPVRKGIAVWLSLGMVSLMFVGGFIVGLYSSPDAIPLYSDVSRFIDDIHNQYDEESSTRAVDSMSKSLNLFGMSSHGKGSIGETKALFLSFMVIFMAFQVQDGRGYLRYFGVLINVGVQMVLCSASVYTERFSLAIAQLFPILMIVGALLSYKMPIREDSVELRLIKDLKYLRKEVFFTLRQNKWVLLGLILLVCRELADAFGLLALL